MRTSIVVLVFSLCLFIQSAHIFSQMNDKTATPQLFGHRGCRGILPENTLEGFRKAIELGVDGIEWDVVVSKDGQLIISHEPYIHSDYCLDTNGTDLTASEGKKRNIYEMTSAEVARYDCGSKSYSKFPKQEHFKVHKPSVQEAFNKLNLSKTTILFEVKSVPSEYGIYQPQPDEFARIIAQEINGFEHKKNIIFMSFDPQLLEALHTLLPDYRYVYLTYKPFVSVTQFLTDLTFKPYALGMYYRTIRKRDVKLAHKKGVNVFSWTVNEQKAFNRMVNHGVDGIITDYPDVFTRR
jgi:glycerophosphoryl diester phosphodiesterase